MGRLDEILTLITEITGHVVDNDPEDIGSFLFCGIYVYEKYCTAQRNTQCDSRSDGYYASEIFPYAHCVSFIHSVYELKPFHYFAVLKQSFTGFYHALKQIVRDFLDALIGALLRYAVPFRILVTRGLDTPLAHQMVAELNTMLPLGPS